MKIIRYTLEQYNKAMQLKKEGFGSLRISKILGLKSRNAVEDWINKGRKPYDFSESRIKACNSKENVERIRKMNKITQPKAVRISALLRTKRLPDSARILDENLAYILGVIYGDGHVSVKQRKVILSATDYDFVDNFRNILGEWSRFKVRFYNRKIKDVPYIKSRKLQWVAYIDSIEAAKFLKNFNLNELENSDYKIKCSFLKGFFDSEGCVGIGGNLTVYNSNHNLIQFVENLLNSLNMETSLRSSYGYTPDKTKRALRYTVSVLARSRKRFLNLIGFTIVRKQRRLIQLCSSSSMKQYQQEVHKMSEERYNKGDRTVDDHIVYIGSKPFMKLS